MLQDVHAIRQRVYGLFIMATGVPDRECRPVAMVSMSAGYILNQKQTLQNPGSAGSLMKCRCFGVDSPTYLQIPGGGSGYTVGFK
jgi:hypothetical protein